MVTMEGGLLGRSIIQESPEIKGLNELQDRVIMACGTDPLDTVLAMALAPGANSAEILATRLNDYGISATTSAIERRLGRGFARSGLLKKRYSNHTIDPTEVDLLRFTAGSLIDYSLRFGTLPLSSQPDYHLNLAILQRLQRSPISQDEFKTIVGYRGDAKGFMTKMISEGLAAFLEPQPNRYRRTDTSTDPRTIPIDSTLRRPMANIIAYFTENNVGGFEELRQVCTIGDLGMCVGYMNELVSRGFLQRDFPESVKRVITPVGLSAKGEYFLERVIGPVQSACRAYLEKRPGPIINLEGDEVGEFYRLAKDLQAQQYRLDQHIPFKEQQTAILTLLLETGPQRHGDLVARLGRRINNVLPGMLEQGALQKLVDNGAWYMLPGQERPNSTTTPVLTNEIVSPVLPFTPPKGILPSKRLSHCSSAELLPAFDNAYIWRNLLHDLEGYRASPAYLEDFIFHYTTGYPTGQIITHNTDSNRAGERRNREGKLIKGKYFELLSRLGQNAHELIILPELQAVREILPLDALAILKTLLYKKAPAEVKQVLKNRFGNDWTNQKGEIIGRANPSLHARDYGPYTEMFQDLEKGRVARALLDTTTNGQVAASIYRAIGEGDKACQDILGDNFPLVFSTCYRYNMPINSRTIRLGIQGLEHAVMGYQWRLGMAFSTYAVGCIRGYILKSVIDTEDASLFSFDKRFNLPSDETGGTLYDIVPDKASSMVIDGRMGAIAVGQHLSRQQEQGLISPLQHDILWCWLGLDEGELGLVDIAVKLHISEQAVAAELRMGINALRKVADQLF